GQQATKRPDPRCGNASGCFADMPLRAKCNSASPTIRLGCRRALSLILSNGGSCKDVGLRSRSRYGLKSPWAADCCNERLLSLVRHFLVALIAMHFVTVGWASAQAPVGSHFAWDGLGQDPNKPLRSTKRVMRLPAKPDPNADRRKMLSTLQPYSAAWWIVHDE